MKRRGNRQYEFDVFYEELRDSGVSDAMLENFDECEFTADQYRRLTRLVRVFKALRSATINEPEKSALLTLLAIYETTKSAVQSLRPSEKHLLCELRDRKEQS